MSHWGLRRWRLAAVWRSSGSKSLTAAAVDDDQLRPALFGRVADAVPGLLAVEAGVAQRTGPGWLSHERARVLDKAPRRPSVRPGRGRWRGRVCLPMPTSTSHPGRRRIR